LGQFLRLLHDQARQFRRYRWRRFDPL